MDQYFIDQLKDKQDRINSLEIKLNNLRTYEYNVEHYIAYLSDRVEKSDEEIRLLKEKIVEMEAKSIEARRECKEREDLFNNALNDLMDNYEKSKYSFYSETVETMISDLYCDEEFNPSQFY